MARRRNRLNEPAEKAYKCVMEECNFVLRNRFFPKHYVKHHERPTGRFVCSACDYKCSNKAICVTKHIRRAHKNSKARAIYNPFLNPEARRVKTEHTDECREEKLRAKPKRIRKVSKKKIDNCFLKNKRRSTRLSTARGSKDTTNEEIAVTDETKAGGKRKWKRNLNSDFERPAKKRRSDNLILNRDIPSTSRGVVHDVMEEEDDFVETEETTEREVDEAVTNDDESDDEEVSNNITSNQSFKSISTENERNIFPEQNLEQGSSISSPSDDKSDAEDSDEAEEEVIEENDVEIQEINEVNPVDADRIRRRRGRDRVIQLMGHVTAHNNYSEAEFDDLMLELMRKFTENPKWYELPTATLIEIMTGRNPDVIFWRQLSFPSRLGDVTKINDVHECILKSADKLQVNFIEYLVNSSEKFRKDLAKMLWKTLMLRAAVYRADETIAHSEELKKRLLSLRCLADAYKRANR